MARRTLKLVAVDRPFVVRGSKIAGKGAFATRDIKKGERIIEYLGERITRCLTPATTIIRARRTTLFCSM